MKPTLTQARIDRAVEKASDIFEVPRREIVSRCRLPRSCEARLSVYAALYRTCQTSYPELSRMLNRDHTTLISGIRKIEGLARADKDYETALIQIAQAAA